MVFVTKSILLLHVIMFSICFIDKPNLLLKTLKNPLLYIHKEGRKEGNVLFNEALYTFCIHKEDENFKTRKKKKEKKEKEKKRL